MIYNFIQFAEGKDKKYNLLLMEMFYGSVSFLGCHDDNKGHVLTDKGLCVMEGKNLRKSIFTKI
jgi:hypothetical protein